MIYSLSGSGRYLVARRGLFEGSWVVSTVVIVK